MANRTASPDGVLLIHKHAGVTSHDIVGCVRRLYGTRAVGHAGTLDPMATGVLVVLLGRAAKTAEYLSGESKRYTARLRLGLTTDTEDVTGTVCSTADTLPDADRVLATVPLFCGKIMQTPPMYSALKVDGQKLYDLARQGKVIERTPRPITIYSLTCQPTDTPSDYILDVRCSGGTYIRTLCADIGARLGCGGVMAALERTEACGFTLAQCISIAELEAMTPEERTARLIPSEELFQALPAVVLSPFNDHLICNGCAVSLKKLNIAYPTGQRLRICHPNGTFFALGEVVECSKGVALKSIKTFVLPQ